MQKLTKSATTLLAAVVNDSDDAIISIDLNGVIQSWNRAAEELYDYKEEEAIGQLITITYPQDIKGEEDEILEKIMSDQKIDHYQTVRQHKDGTRIEVSATISPINDADGQIIGASKIIRDITEYKRQKEELKALNEHLEERVERRTKKLLSYQKQLRSLAMQLSQAEEDARSRLASELHDNLGQMLAVVKMKINSLKTEPASETIQEASQLVDESIQYTRKLMSDLKPPPSLKDNSVSAALQWVIQRMDQYNLTVNFEHYPNDEPSVDEELQTTVVQAVRELLFNVIKHANADKADIELSFPGAMVKVVVQDYGKGFEPEKVNGNATNGGGFGLFHIKERLNVLGGHLNIASTPGEGTRITLTVPQAGSEQETPEDGIQTDGEPQEQQMAASERSYRKIKVLLVDDHDMMRDGLRNIIEQEDDLTVVAEAAEAETAIDTVNNETSPDVIIMDINLPGMNGIEATNIIKDQHPDIKIIGLSFHEDDKVKREMHEAGASAYLGKGNASEALCASIRSEGE